MGLRIVSNSHTSLESGQTWYFRICADSDATVSCTITTPAGGSSTPTMTYDSTYREWRGSYAPSTTGRFIAAFSVADAEFEQTNILRAVAYVGAVVPEADMPDAADVLVYLGETSVVESEAALVLAAEAAAQRARCRIPAAYPADLREALLRRCARNLAARSVPVTQFTSFEGLGTSTRVPANDPEIARLEAPHRRLVVG